MDPSEHVPSLIDAARGGDAAALDALLQRYRAWLLVLAEGQVGGRLAAKCDASDVVQQVLIDAYRGLPNFHGTTEAELCAWLRQVLARALGHELRRYAGTLQRDVGREVSLEDQLAESS